MSQSNQADPFPPSDRVSVTDPSLPATRIEAYEKWQANCDSYAARVRKIVGNAGEAQSDIRGWMEWNGDVPPREIKKLTTQVDMYYQQVANPSLDWTSGHYNRNSLHKAMIDQSLLARTELDALKRDSISFAQSGSGLESKHKVPHLFEKLEDTWRQYSNLAGSFYALSKDMIISGSEDKIAAWWSTVVSAITPFPEDRSCHCRYVGRYAPNYYEGQSYTISEMPNERARLDGLETVAAEQEHQLLRPAPWSTMVVPGVVLEEEPPEDLGSDLTGKTGGSSTGTTLMSSWLARLGW